MTEAGTREPQPGPRTHTSDLADSSTPFIYNAWYVIAPANEVTRTPVARTALGNSIMLFRKLDGEVVALQNRCCHRSFPLAHGTVDGDTIVCGYHGLRYDCSGKCIEIPMQKSVPAALRVRAYPAVEKGPFVWIWMGERPPANGEIPPHQEWLDQPEWAVRWGYLHVNGSYVHMHENLLDLSHLSFLHSKTFGTPEYARTPVEINCEGDNLEVWRHVQCELPPIYSKPLGWAGARAMRSSGSKYVSPGLHVNTGIFRNLDLPETVQTPQPMVRVAQLVTPESPTTTHYWTAQARNFAIDDAAMGEFMIGAQIAAFREDAFALEQITALQGLAGTGEFEEISIPTDKAGVLMRRRLRKLAELERADRRGDRR
jgi:phenylpropionate dioxygenase-like ring-hydroxylating dioxygenase large terminal subunit